MQPSISCICPTFNRSRLLEESIESFLRQDYKGKKELIIINDFYKQKLEFNHPEVIIINQNEVAKSLGGKINNAIYKYARYDLIAVWEDDDIYLSRNLSLRVKYLGDKKASLIHNAFFIADNFISTKISSNTFHGQFILTKKLFDEIGGYPETYKAHDIKIIKKIPKFDIKRNTKLSPVNISYIYRWRYNGSRNLSSFFSKESEEETLKRIKKFQNKQLSLIKEEQTINLNPHWDYPYEQIKQFDLKHDSVKKKILLSDLSDRQKQMKKLKQSDHLKPKVNKDWQLHWLDNQPVLFSKFDEDMHLLNPVAGFIWTCCDGKTDVKSIRKNLQEIFADNQDEVANDLPKTLEHWKEKELINFHITAKKRKHYKLCIGMATYDDFDGVYFSTQAINFYHPEVADEICILVVDNNPYGPIAEELQKLENHIENYYYVSYVEKSSTTVKDIVFREANSDYVLCIDCHVFIQPGAIRKLIDFLDENPNCNDLLQGPLVYDNMKSISTHMDPKWRGGMFGIWGTDERGKDIEGESFEIPSQGTGLFACRKDAWLGFNPRFRGFGAEEGYIHEKFRQKGNKALCLPFLRWLHRFSRPLKIPYPIKWKDRIYNYLVGFDELNLDGTKQLKEHFSTEVLDEETTKKMITEIQEEINSPFNFFDAIYCINVDFESESSQEMQKWFHKLHINERIRGFIAIETIDNHHLGFLLSHREIVKKAKRHGLNNVLVLEINTIFPDDINQTLQANIEELKQDDWKVFYLGGDKLEQSFLKLDGSQYLEKISGGVSSTQAIAYHSSFFDEMLGHNIGNS